MTKTQTARAPAETSDLSEARPPDRHRSNDGGVVAEKRARFAPYMRDAALYLLGIAILLLLVTGVAAFMTLNRAGDAAHLEDRIDRAIEREHDLEAEIELSREATAAAAASDARLRDFAFVMANAVDIVARAASEIDHGEKNTGLGLLKHEFPEAISAWLGAFEDGASPQPEPEPDGTG